MSLTPGQLRRLQAWGVHSLTQVDDHPFAWWARRGEDYVVVKAGDIVERAREAHALRALGPGATSVTQHDADLGLLVTHRVLPGDDIRPLARIDDDAATLAVAQLTRRLHSDQRAPVGLPDLGDLGAALVGPLDPRLPEHVVRDAHRVFVDLMGHARGVVVLHGDLQHLNVLNTGDGWCAIDPHGWVGDPTFEAAALLASPRGLVEAGDARGMDGGALARLTRRRAAIYAETTGYDEARILAWALVGCVVAEVRMITVHDLVHGAPLAVAERLLSDGVG